MEISQFHRPCCQLRKITHSTCITEAFLLLTLVLMTMLPLFSQSSSRVVMDCSEFSGNIATTAGPVPDTPAANAPFLMALRAISLLYPIRVDTSKPFMVKQFQTSPAIASLVMESITLAK